MPLRVFGVKAFLHQAAGGDLSAESSGEPAGVVTQVTTPESILGPQGNRNEFGVLPGEARVPG